MTKDGETEAAVVEEGDVLAVPRIQVEKGTEERSAEDLGRPDRPTGGVGSNRSE